MKYARIEEGVVKEIGEFDSIENRFHPSLIWVECSEEVKESFLYDGAVFLPPPIAKKFIPSKVTMRQARLALLSDGLLDSVNAAIAASTQSAQIEWEFATTLNRDNPLTVSLSESLGLTQNNLDDLFIKASKL